MNFNQEILKQTTIDRDNPGTILADWQTMLDFIRQDGIEVSQKQGYFSLKILQEINQKLTHSILIDLKRPQQKSYPYIHGLYLLLRFSGITKIINQKSKRKLVINFDILEQWNKLNYTEQYLILLELWMFWVSESAMQGYYHTANLFLLARIWLLLPDQGVRITSKNETVYNLNRSDDLVNLAVLDLFGLIELQQGKPLPGKGWRLTYLRKTDLGKAVIDFLMNSVDIDSFLRSEDDGKQLIYGQLLTDLQKFFPEFKQNLIIKNLSDKKGIFIFKVSLGKAWRIISIPSELILDELADIILEAFEFEDIFHLYRFVCESNFGTPLSINHPEMEESPYTDEVKVGELPLEVGQTMIFNFDFGDDWKFNLLLEEILPPDDKQQEAKIIKVYGKAPSQYYEDEYEEDAGW